MGVNLPSDLQNLTANTKQLGDIGGLAAGLSNFDYASTQNAVTASTTQTQAGGTKINYAICRVTTAAANDAVTLNFAATAGRKFVLINDSGQNVRLFPKLGDKLNDAAINAVNTLADNTVSIYYCPLGGLWFGGTAAFAT